MRLRSDIWRVSAEKRYTRGASDEMILDAAYKLSRLWSVRFYGRYEFENNDLEEQQYLVTRDLHCWLADFGFSIRDTEDVKDDTTFWVIFRLKAFPETPFKLKGSYDGWGSKKSEPEGATW
ncbi:MAG: hypothetical protein HY350_01210 [Candidatus Omnitrophica bacterium]|nr:hypothetical protein [Candidatus Omnitrophota bacterium]